MAHLVVGVAEVVPVVERVPGGAVGQGGLPGIVPGVVEGRHGPGERGAGRQPAQPLQLLPEGEQAVHLVDGDG